MLRFTKTVVKLPFSRAAATVAPAHRLLASIPAKTGSIFQTLRRLNSPSKSVTTQNRTPGFRLYSVLTQNAAKKYKYDDVKTLTQRSATGTPDTLLIDVREPEEYQEGHIPGALNVPFKSSPGAFDLTEEEFEESFGFPKPGKDQQLVFYCLSGVRLTAAEELANSFGYTKRGNYIGSWEDWVTHETEKAAKKA